MHLERCKKIPIVPITVRRTQLWEPDSSVLLPIELLVLEDVSIGKLTQNLACSRKVLKFFLAL